MGDIAAAAKSEADWQAEDDMRTLARAEEIRSDPKRLAAAKKKAKAALAEMDRKRTAMQTAAGAK